ncbi:uncharacterized protein LOC135704831 [Ochlerotatus camptorhynchus]|uniref:uncharacterized protein LOC135704831 n=1 Tax=Ochlerotatus camptorhynchus TaxID=644619 RepID=UPI0031DACEA1
MLEEEEEEEEIGTTLEAELDHGKQQNNQHNQQQQKHRSRAISPMPHEELVQLSSSNKNWVHASTRQSHISPQIGRTSSLNPITACLQSSTPSPSDSVLSSVTSSSDSSLNTVPCTPEHRVNVSRQLNYGPRKLPRVSGIVGEVNNGWPQELQNEQSATGRQSRTPSSRSITLAEESPQLPSVSGIVGKVNNDRSQLQNEHTDTGRHNRTPSSRYITVAEESLQLPSVSGIVDKVNNGRPQELQNEHIATGCQSRTPSPLAFTVGVESPQIRFRASNTHEEFVPETGSLERDNCKNCQKVKKRLENAETRIHVLTELNLNLQMEKVKLMAQNKEKAPFVNSVEEWLTPEIVLRTHIESPAGSEGDGRFISALADHLWNREQLQERSVKGKMCNLHPKSGTKKPATPSKVAFILEKLVQRVDIEGDLEPKRKIPSRVSRKLNEKMANARRKTVGK